MNGCTATVFATHLELPRNPISGSSVDEVLIIRILGSSSFKDMQMGASLQKEKPPASLTVYSLVLLRDWHRAAKVRDEGPGIRLERPGASPSLSSLSY
jgi:hypothetical protein